MHFSYVNFISSKVFIFLTFLLISSFICNAQAPVVSCGSGNGNCYSIGAVNDCGGGEYKVQHNGSKWSRDGAWITVGGSHVWCLGYTISNGSYGGNWLNCGGSSGNKKGVREGSNSPATKYIRINTSTKVITWETTNFTCVSTSAPTITTSTISSTTCSSASSGGESISDGGASITAKGVCWSTSTNPTTSDNTTSDGSGTSSFSSSITGLAASTTYYVRAYAVNSVGTSYGAQVSFTTSAGPSVSSSSGGSRCGTGTVNISASASAGSIDWYAASSGGASLGSSSSGASWTTPSISETTTYYAEAVDGSCTSASRTAVTATVTNLTITSTTPGSRTGAGVVTLNATTSGGNIKWYDAASGGTLLATRASGSAWQTSSISTTTTYYAEADDGTCTSASRSAVTATVLYPPGGVGTNLRLWLKADAGTSSSTDAADVNTWTDQSLNAYSASGYVAGGKYYENGINFNPTITFDGANDYYTISGGIIGSGVNIDDAFVYYVGTFDTDNTKMAVFHESCNDAANGGNSSYWKFQREADADIWYNKGRASSSYSLIQDDWEGLLANPICGQQP